jgi:hypothetical protein
MQSLWILPRLRILSWPFDFSYCDLSGDDRMESFLREYARNMYEL